MTLPSPRSPLRTCALLGLVLAAGCGRSPEKLLEAGAEALRAGDYAEAREDLAAALETLGEDPTVAGSFNLLGVAAEATGDTVAAETAFRRALELDPSLADAAYNLGVMKCGQNAWEEGAALLNQAAAANPRDTLALEFLAAEHGRRGDWAGAQAALLAAQARAPAEPRVLTALALAGLRTEGPLRAATLLGQALEQDPAYSPALFSLARLHAEWTGEPGPAIERYRAFLSRTGGDETRRAHAREEIRRLESAPESAVAAAAPDEALPPRPDTPAGPVQDLLNKAAQAARAGDASGAFKLCLEAAAKAAEARDADLELKAYRTATALCPTQAQAHYRLGRHLSARGRTREALDAYVRATELEPAWTTALRAAAAAAIACGEFQAAHDALNKAVKAEPSNPDALWALALFYETQMKLTDSARQQYERFLRNFPAHARAADAQRRIATLGGKPDSGGPPKPPRPGVDALFRQASELQERGDPDQAVAAYQRVLAVNPDHAPTHFNLGLLHLQRKDNASARTHYARFLELAPNDPEAPVVRRWLMQQ